MWTPSSPPHNFCPSGVLVLQMILQTPLIRSRVPSGCRLTQLSKPTLNLELIGNEDGISKVQDGCLQSPQDRTSPLSSNHRRYSGDSPEPGVQRGLAVAVIQEMEDDVLRDMDQLKGSFWTRTLLVPPSSGWNSSHHSRQDPRGQAGNNVYFHR